MNGNKFTILILADAHIGKPDQGLDSSLVFEPLLKDLSDAYNGEHRKPDLIVFCGDLAYGEIHDSRIAEQYCSAKKLFESICGCFGEKCDSIPILIVPGNHDINRAVIDEPQKEYRNKLTDENITEMIQKGTIAWKRIQERQKDWYDFATAFAHRPWTWHPNFFCCTGILDVTLTSGEVKKIGVVGLNSSWASHEQKEQGNLRIGTYQYNFASKEVKDTYLRLVVSHHPTDWLHEEEKAQILQKIETNFQIFIHGHEHTQWFNDSKGHLRCAAGACYQGSKERNGYSWLEIDLENHSAKIHLREFTPQGSGGWRANHIPGKTEKDGTCELYFLRGTDDGQEPVEKKARVSGSQRKCHVASSDLWQYLKMLEDRFFFRWERGNLDQDSSAHLIYWPVRLRHPSPIHAAQCFVAAGLQKMGCQISLWIDDLGRKEYDVDQFVWTLKRWYTAVGGQESGLNENKFSTILDDVDGAGYTEHAWTNLQKWLGTMSYYTDNILKISKIWPTTEPPDTEDSEAVLAEMAKRRPRRLMTPSMVWTCMSVLHEANSEMPIMTLGGIDELDLWAAWRTCCGTRSLRAGHIYVSKLTTQAKKVEQAIHMSSQPLDWQSKEDIENEFQKALAEGDSQKTWVNVRSMIPWTVNNCALLPAYVFGKPGSISIRGQEICSLADMESFVPSDVLDDIVDAVSKWLL